MERKWWHGKVAYQIYPKSFCDSNGDGIGDIEGIISKLDYLAWLGVEIVWISPVYASPFVDQGYDISDYYDIDPIFGSLEDMERLIQEAKKRGISIIMDLVVNHCSDQHYWFQEMLKDPNGPYSDYFYIREGEDGQPPCNWRSYFGGSVWEPIPGTEKYYLHLFAKEQPDLNWENKKVREEIYKMINWWLDKGIAGFRIDAIINIKKDLTFSDMEPDRDDGLSSCTNMIENAEGVMTFLNELSDQTFKKYDAFTIAELFNYDPDDLEEFIGEKGCFSSIFDFSTALIGMSEKGWHKHKEVTPENYIKTVFDSQMMTQNIGFLANIIENHDTPRGVSRYLSEASRNAQGKSMLATIMMMLKGLPFLYQGQEIGMTNNEFQSIKDVDDISTKDAYHLLQELEYSDEEALEIINRYSRDHSRTPMQWDATINAGFTTSQPWLEVNANYTRINVENQKKAPDSLLNHYKELITLRKDSRYSEVIVYGELVKIETHSEGVMAFYRKNENQNLLVIANFNDELREIKEITPSKQMVIINDNYGERNIGDLWLDDEQSTLRIKPYQAIIIEMN